MTDKAKDTIARMAGWVAWCPVCKREDFRHEHPEETPDETP